MSKRFNSQQYRTVRIALWALLTAALIAAVQVGQARGEATWEEKQAELNRVVQRQQEVADSIEEQNRRIDALIGTVSRARQRVEQINARLAERQAELDRATAALAEEQAQLQETRRRLRRSLESLKRTVVDIYRAGGTDLAGVLVGANDWSEAISSADYLSMINDQRNATVHRVEDLRDQSETAVDRLTEARERIAAARDRVAAERERAEAARARVQRNWDALVAERERREQTLAGLEDRQEALEDDLRVSVPSPGERAVLVNGQAIAPAGAPAPVKAAIAAANSIAHTPYIWGGGHGSFESPGYDCSGAVSYALHGAGLLSSPLDSTGLTFWGEPGEGGWITVYAHGGHAYIVIAGLRFDTSGTGGSGPRWHEDMRSPAGFIPRHPAGL